MNRLPLVAKTLRDYRVSVVAIGLTIVLMALVVMLVYPTYSEALADMEVPAGFEGFIGEAGDWSSPAGFLAAEFFSWIPLVLIVLAIIAGTGAVAGEEAAGTMDLLLAQPVSRRRYLLERFAGIALAVTLAAAFALPGFAIGKLAIGYDVSYWRMTQATVNMLPVTYLFVALALLGSSALPGRGAATMLSVGVVVLAYFLYSIGAAVEALDWMAKVTPFYWSDNSRVLAHGFDWLRAGVLLAVAGVLLALAVVAFERRDIASTGRAFRPWAALRRGRAREDAPGHRTATTPAHDR
ncbi:MAG: ABC transporter permease subunit [Dehalococcoidia bacterium]|nr:ABC transporter permease subunit [Dehalococcoidia bacterium]